MDKDKITGDYVLDWMIKNLPPDKITLRAYVGLSWCGDKTVAEVVNDGELAADLPEQLYPEPVSKLVM
jgi:hypothetical protein